MSGVTQLEEALNGETETLLTLLYPTRYPFLTTVKLKFYLVSTVPATPFQGT